MQDVTLLAHGYLWAFVTVFVGGFLTSLTPCVYPLIPITVSLFGARDQDTTRARALLLAACYVAGIGVMYASLGVASALAGRAFGTFMASPWVMVPIALLFLVMAASMFGAFELNLPPELAARLSRVGGKGVGGAFAMGMVGGIIAAPCTGPVLASVLAYVSTSRSVAIGGSLLFTYALGMGVLFFAIAAFAVALPKSGAWMETVKSIFGVVMTVAALYFLRNVSAPLRSLASGAPIWLACSILLVIAGVASGAVHLSFHEPSFSVRLRKAVGVVAVVAGVFGAIGFVLTPRTAGAQALTWLHGEQAGLQRARAEGKPALMDFYADWCLPCKELELKTFSDPEVTRELMGYVLVKVDCTTDDDPAVVEAKQRWGAATLPTLVILGADGKVRTRIDHFVDAPALRAALAAAR
jgi:thiol:disulfide interchange protein DsbD